MKKALSATAALMFAVAAITLSVSTAPAEAATLPKCTKYTNNQKSLVDPTKRMPEDYGPAIRMPASSSGNVQCSMKQGDKGDEVLALQLALKFCYDQNGLTTDGVWGAKTTAALKKAYASAGIKEKNGQPKDGKTYDHILKRYPQANKIKNGTPYSLTKFTGRCYYHTYTYLP